MGDTNIVENWLHSMNLARYSKAFIDNGYDDLEVCKLIDLPDLKAIGVETDDRGELLEAVRTLREEGGTAVYFTLELLRRSTDDGGDSPNHVDSEVYGRNQIEIHNLPDDSKAGKKTPEEISPPVHCQWQPTSVYVCHGKRYSYIDPSSITSDRNLDEFTSRCQTARSCSCSPRTQVASETGIKRSCSGGISPSTKDSNDVTQSTTYSTMVTAGSHRCRSSASRLCSPKTSHNKSCVSLGPRQQLIHSSLQSHAMSCHEVMTLGQASPMSDCGNNSCRSHATNGQPFISHCLDCGDVRKGDGKWTSRNGERRENGKWRRRNLALSKLFKFRKSNKPMYRSVAGDLRASDITMSESDRMQLMVLVKEGKISTTQALEEVRRYEEKVHEDFLRDMDKIHASEVKIPVCMPKSNKGSLLDLVRRSVHRLKLLKARSKDVPPMEDGYLVPQCCCTVHRGTKCTGQGLGHTDCPQQFDQSGQFVDWPWHDIHLDARNHRESGTVTSNDLENLQYPSCNVSHASLSAWQLNGHSSQASILPWKQNRHFSEVQVLPCQQSRHASHASLLPCQQSRHASHASPLPWQQNICASQASLSPCQHNRHASQATLLPGQQSRPTSQATLLPWQQSRPTSQATLLPWQQSRPTSQATLLPWQESMQDMRRLSADICDSCRHPTFTHKVDTSTQRWSTVECPVSQLCSHCHGTCHHLHCHHPYCPTGCSTGPYCDICDNVHHTCTTIHEFDSITRDHKSFSPPLCSCGETTNDKPRWQHSHQPIMGTKCTAAPSALPCYNSVDSLPSYSDAYSGTINPDFVSMISLNSSSMCEPSRAARMDAPKIQRLENFGTEMQCGDWDSCWETAGSIPHPPAARKDVGVSWYHSETRSAPDLCHRSIVQMPASSRLNSVELFTDVDEEDELEDCKIGSSGQAHVRLRDISSGSETDDERSLHNAMSHLNVNQHRDTNTEDKGTQVTGDTDITDTTVADINVRDSDTIGADIVSIKQVNTMNDTDDVIVHVTADNCVNERSSCDTKDNYTLVGGGIQRHSPLVEMDCQQECCPLVATYVNQECCRLGCDDSNREIVGADLVALRDSGCYDASQNSSLDGNLPTSASYPNVAVMLSNDICFIPKYSTWAAS